MGTTLSTIILFGGLIITMVTSFMASHHASNKAWKQAEMWAGITAGIAIILSILALIIIVRGHMGVRGAVAGVVSLMAFGVTIACVLMMLAMIGVAILEVFAMVEAAKQDKSSRGLSIGSGLLSLGAFVIALPIMLLVP